MNTKKTAILISSALMGLLATTAMASAASIPAYAKSAVNVRTGPSVSYNKVDTLHRGENVTVRECQSGWCYVDHSGPDGWVSANYLGQRGVSSGGSSSSSSPAVNFRLTFGSGSGPSLSISVGSGGSVATPPPPPAPVTPKVCFYKNNNYNGSNFCVAPGTNDNHLSSSWNNKISSIKVFGGAHVQICQNYNYGGGCVGVHSNQWTLPASMNNKTSSYHTWM